MNRKKGFKGFVSEYKLVIFLAILFLVLLGGIAWYIFNELKINDTKTVVYEDVLPSDDNPDAEDEETYRVRKEFEQDDVNRIQGEAKAEMDRANEATPTPSPSPTPEATKKPKKVKLTKGQKAFLEREKKRKKSKKN